MRIKTVGNLRDTGIVNIRNGHATLAIKEGSPVFLDLDGTNDGLGVVPAPSLPAIKEKLFWGIATKELAVGALGEAQVFGMYETARVVRQTRAASTDAYASYPAGSVGQQLSAITLAGVQGMIPIAETYTFADVTGTASGITFAGTLTRGLSYAMLAETFASSTTADSDAGVAGELALTSQLKVILRAL